MQKIKYKLSLLLSLMFFFISFNNPIMVNAQASTLPRSASIIGGNLSEWLLDEANGYIYTFSGDTDKLLFIGTDDLKIKKEFKLSGISDIEIFNGKLYAALESDRQIVVINTKTAVIEKKLTVQEMPYKIALDGNKLFYATRPLSGEGQRGFTKLHIFGLESTAETEIDPTAHIPGYEGFYTRYHISALAADRENHRLYIGNSDGHSSFVFSISTEDNKLLSYYDREGFIGQYSNIILDGSDVFFGKYRLDKEDLRKVYGSYENAVTYLKGNYIFSANRIYDRVNFIKSGEFNNGDYYSNFLLDSKGNIYLYEGQSYSVSKSELSRFLYNKPGEDGTNPGDTLPADYNADTVGSNTSANRPEISRWLVDDQQRMIYAFTKESNSLLFIGLNDLKLKKQIFVGKGPSHMALSDGKLYVSLSDIHQVVVVDLKSRSIQRNVVLKYRPGALAVDGNKLFYMGYEEKTPYEEQSTEKSTQLYVYDLVNNTEKIAAPGNPVSGVRSFESNLVLDKVHHVLYIGAETGNGLRAISTSNYEINGMAASGVMHREYKAMVSKDGDNLYYSRFKVAREHLGTTYGYFAEPILYAGGGLAFSKKAVYDPISFEKVAEFPFESDNIYLDGEQNVYLYNKELHAIKRYSLKPSVESFGKVYETLVRDTYYGVKGASVFNLGRKVQIRQIVVDELKGYIYAISPDSYKLLVLGKDDLKLKKEVVVGLSPKDMRLVDGKLYIAVSGTNYVAVVDTATLEVSKKIYLSNSPELVEVDGNNLFYRDSWRTYVFDMSLKVEKKVNFYDFQYGYDINYVYNIFLDNENHVLYAATSNSELARGLAAVSTVDLKPLKLPAKIGKFSTLKTNGVPVFDGKDLFRGQGRFDRSDYSVKAENLVGQILYVDNKYIITSYSVYFRGNNAKVGDLSEYIDNLHVDGNGNVYSINLYKWAINKTSIGEILSSMKNKTGVEEPKEAENIPEGGEGNEGEVGKVEDKIITFPDISTHWAKSDIEFLASKQIIEGRGRESKIFAPEDKVTRAEFVTMLVRALNISNRGSSQTTFTDVDAGDWYYSSIMAASGIGLVEGRGNGSFAPNDLVTREEIAALSTRALKYRNVKLETANSSVLAHFDDNSRISSWARDSAATAVKAGIIKGRSGNLFSPRAMTTRAESAVVLKRILER
jgi:YVTN family beta-propeller protein